jgi:hypothetical protein
MAAGSRVGRKQAEPGKVEVVRWIPAATAVPVRFHSAFTHASACVSDRRDRTAAPEYPKGLIIFYFLSFFVRVGMTQEPGMHTNARTPRRYPICANLLSYKGFCVFFPCFLIIRLYILVWLDVLFVALSEIATT